MLPIGEVLWPRHAAVERTDYKRNVVFCQSARDKTLVGRAQWRNAMDQIKLACCNPITELSPDSVFERVIGKRRKSRQRCPADTRSAPQTASHLPNWGGRIFVVYGREVASFD